MKVEVFSSFAQKKVFEFCAYRTGFCALLGVQCVGWGCPTAAPLRGHFVAEKVHRGAIDRGE